MCQIFDSRMKRTLEESKKIPKVQAYTGDRIKVAVHAACLHRGI